MSDAPELILYQEALRRVTAERDAANAEIVRVTEQLAEMFKASDAANARAEEVGRQNRNLTVAFDVAVEREESLRAELAAARAEAAALRAEIILKEQLTRAEVARYRAALEEIRDGQHSEGARAIATRALAGEAGK